MAQISVADHDGDLQATIDAVAAAGGGVALVPEGSFEWSGTLTVPDFVVLRGTGDLSVLSWSPPEVDPELPEPVAIRFEEDPDNGQGHHGGLEGLQISRVLPDPPQIAPHVGIGVDLTGARFLRLRDLRIWYFAIGVRMSDGVTEFAGYNHLSDFEINACRIGLQAWEHTNQCSVREGRIWNCRDPEWNPDDPASESGVAIDVRGAQALDIEHIAVENFDLGVRITGFTRVALNNVYYEADVHCPPEAEPPADPPCVEPPPGRWMDVRPELGSVVRLESSRGTEGSIRTLGVEGSLEDAIVSDVGVYLANAGTSSESKRHHAAAPERNLVENGDFHRAAGASFSSIPGWFPWNNPDLEENTAEGTYLTGGRSYDVIRNSDPNDGIGLTFTVPETTDYVTVMVRFQNIDSRAPLFRVDSGGNTSFFADPRPSDPSPGPEIPGQPAIPAEWRVAAITVEVDHLVPPEERGVVRVLVVVDQGPGDGTRIRVDEVWAVIGATAAPSRAHAHRVELLEAPVRVVTRANVNTTTTFPQTDLVGLPGLGRAPRGAIGAVLSLRAQTLVGAATAGNLRPTVVTPFVEAFAGAPRYALTVCAERSMHDRQILLRNMSFRDGIRFFQGDTTPTFYGVDVVGWILPS